MRELSIDFSRLLWVTMLWTNTIVWRNNDMIISTIYPFCIYQIFSYSEFPLKQPIIFSKWPNYIIRITFYTVIHAQSIATSYFDYIYLLEKKDN